MNEKQCRTCGKWLPSTEYNRDSKYRDALALHCRECEARLRRERNARYPPRNYPQKRTSEYWRQARQSYEQRYPGRKVAENKVNQAIKMGRIPRANTQVCANCGGEGEIYHHSDYNKPFDIVPMCKSCHRKWHYRNKPIDAL